MVVHVFLICAYVWLWITPIYVPRLLYLIRVQDRRMKSNAKAVRLFT